MNVDRYCHTCKYLTPRSKRICPTCPPAAKLKQAAGVTLRALGWLFVIAVTILSVIGWVIA